MRALVRTAADALLVRLPRRTAPGDRLVLAYHNIVPTGWTAQGDRSLHLPLDRFEAQLDVLQAELAVVPLLELLSTPDPYRRRVAITFDDAYASSLALGVAACEARGLPCTVFVAPALLGRVPVWDRREVAGQWSHAERERFLWQQAGRDVEPVTATELTLDAALRLATSAELAACLARSGPRLTLGNHSQTHANLAALSPPEVADELCSAQTWLQAFAPARSVPVVAYPYGHAPRDPSVCMSHDPALPAWGLLVTGGWQRRGTPMPPLTVPRWNVPAGITVKGFKVRLRGRRTGSA